MHKREKLGGKIM